MAHALYVEPFSKYCLINIVLNIDIIYMNVLKWQLNPNKISSLIIILSYKYLHTI